MSTTREGASFIRQTAQGIETWSLSNYVTAREVMEKFARSEFSSLDTENAVHYTPCVKKLKSVTGLESSWELRLKNGQVWRMKIYREEEKRYAQIVLLGEHDLLALGLL